jgi:mitochondrial fission process protein 1
MWWGKGSSSSDKAEPAKDKAPEASQTPATKIDPRKDATNFDPDRLPARRELPKGLQRIVEKSDKDENFFDELVDG